MYTILVNERNELVATQRERIMQRSKLVDKLHFLVPTEYNGLDMTDTTVCLEYVRPISGEYKTEVLVRSAELYKEHLEYILPIDTDLTKESGQVNLQLTFTWVEMDDTGRVIQHVRKTEPTYINVVPIANWSLQMPDDALTALDQRMIMLDQLNQQIFDINMALADSVPDDLMVKDGRVYLSQNGQVMPNTIGADVVVPRVPDINDGANDGMIEVDDSAPEDGSHENGCDCGCDHDFVELDDTQTPNTPTYNNGFIEV